MSGPSTCTELTVTFCSGTGRGFGFSGAGAGCWANATVAGTRKERARNFRSMRLRSATDCLIKAAAPAAQPRQRKSEERKPGYSRRGVKGGDESVGLGGHED